MLWNAISKRGTVEHLEQYHKHTFLSGLMANGFSSPSAIVKNTWQPHSFSATSKYVANKTIAQDVLSWQKNFAVEPVLISRLAGQGNAGEYSTNDSLLVQRCQEDYRHIY